jgi:hypothetical protein
MAVKVLGQVVAAATTPTTLYTVPAGKSSIISDIVICNRSTSLVSYRLAVRPAGATLADVHYLLYDVMLTANSSDFVLAGITVTATDVITVYASANTLSFTAFGDES